MSFVFTVFFLFKQKTAYEMCISDWSSDVCSSDLPLHEGAPAVDAEALMRSRYSAYALSMVSYLLRSWDESTRPALREADFDPATRWLGLRIVAHEVDPEDAADRKSTRLNSSH